MFDIEYLVCVEVVLVVVECIVDVVNDGDYDIDLECNGSVLMLMFENGLKIIVNLQLLMKEVWIVVKVGGFYYCFIDGEWCDMCMGIEFFLVFIDYVIQQVGLLIMFSV